MNPKAEPPKTGHPGSEQLNYILAVVLFGTVGLFLRQIRLPIEIVAFCRGGIGALFILLYLKVRNRKPDREAIRENRRWLLLSGIALGLNWIFLFASYTLTTVAIASLCNYLAPLIVILAAPVLLHERVEAKKLPCVAAAFMGILLVSGVLEGQDAGNPAGVLTGLLGALCFTTIIICNRKIHGIDALDKAVVQLGTGALTTLPYVLVHNRGVALQPDLRSVLIILLLGVLHTGFGYCIYFSGMGSLPVQTIAILGYLEPVVSIFCSAVFLHESMSLPGWVGAVLILGAAVVSEIL